MISSKSSTRRSEGAIAAVLLAWLTSQATTGLEAVCVYQHRRHLAGRTGMRRAERRPPAR
jgi:hypothetical protein